MTECFADSFVFLAMVNPRDRRHTDAVQTLASLRRPMVTTAWVLTELADGLACHTTRALFQNIEARLRADDRVAIIPPSEELYLSGLALYHDRPDKDWSLTDCISFVVMKDRHIVEALTGDHHFEQAGFVALLK